MHRIRHNFMTLALCLMMAAVPAAHADAPSHPPVDNMVCSNNALYCAVYSSHDDKTRDYEVKANDVSLPLYAVAGWIPYTYVSDTGDVLVALLSDIIPGKNFDQPVIKVWLDGVLMGSLTYSAFTPPQSLMRTSSGFNWGSAVGFNEEGRFVVRTADGNHRTIEVRQDGVIVE